MTATLDQRDAPLAEQPARPAAGVYTVDPVHTFVLFFARHLVIGRVVGQFDRLKGTITVTDRLEDWDVKATIDATSLTTNCGKRDTDLRGPDFFDVAQFPTIRFDGRGIRPAGGHWILDGALTIRDFTVRIALDVCFRGTASTTPPRAGFHASAAVRRADFGMRRDLITEIGCSTAPDVAIEIDAEATPTPTSPSPPLR